MFFSTMPHYINPPALSKEYPFSIPLSHNQHHSMSYRTGSATHFVDGVATVDCQKQVRSWRLLRSLLEFIIPSCNCYYLEEEVEVEEESYHNYKSYNHYPRRALISNTTITGTIFGYRRGKVSFCIQSNSNTTTPILLLELAVPTVILAREMQSGLLRITLECNSDHQQHKSSSSALLSVPVWTMYFNGRKVGFAIKRRPTQADMDVLSLMRSVVVGAGIVIESRKTLKCDDELMYLRANFKRVSGSSDSESFHLINPDGSNGQELSIFFLRTR